MTILSGLHSQTNEDVIWIPRKDALGMLAKVERLKADSAELVLAKTEISDLYEVVNSQRQSLKNALDHIATLDIRISNYESQVNILNNAVKKQKRKTILSTIAGIVTSLGLGYLLITK